MKGIQIIVSDSDTGMHEVCLTRHVETFDIYYSPDQLTIDFEPSKEDHAEAAGQEESVVQEKAVVVVAGKEITDTVIKDLDEASRRDWAHKLSKESRQVLDCIVHEILEARGQGVSC